MGNACESCHNKNAPTTLTWKSTAEDVARFYNADLKGKVALVTGANIGIGYETARVFAGAGAKTYLACRSKDKADQAIKDLVNEGLDKSLFGFLPLDLASLQSVKDAIKEFHEKEEKLDFLILNAGIMACPNMKTKEGFEMQIGVNHIGHHALATRLLDLLEKGDKSRVVVLSSVAHAMGSGKDLRIDDLNWEKRSYGSFKAYSASKMANILFGKELQRLLTEKGSEVTVHIVHPGMVKTNLARHQKWANAITPVLGVVAKVKSAPQGAATSMYCALEPSLQQQPGRYYSNSKEKQPSTRAQDMTLAKQLWEATEDLIEKHLQ